MEINENDIAEIKYLYFEKSRKLEEIERHFKGKYTYQQLLFTTRKMIGGYNGYTVETAEQTISRNKNKRT